MECEDLVDFLNDAIVDPQVRQLLFGMPEVERYDINPEIVPLLISKITKLSFALLYSKWHADGKPLLNSYYGRKATEELSQYYQQFPTDLDLLIDTLVQAEKDVQALENGSYFSTLFSSSFAFHFSRLHDLAAMPSYAASFHSEKLYEEIHGAIAASRGIRKMRLEEGGFQLDGSFYPFEDIVRIRKEGFGQNLYLLYRCHEGKRYYVSFSLANFDWEDKGEYDEKEMLIEEVANQ